MPSYPSRRTLLAGALTAAVAALVPSPPALASRRPAGATPPATSPPATSPRRAANAPAYQPIVGLL
ncbi:hypothetical protein [Streptomyces vilmorinianum]|uniref:hypothetical protein n=1 Tax=Streptomyces vilmorinianum TaxID=3051092 RepID=UPI0010FBB0A2|nr:hypothetical protein [Streptomyces vilmorinianum]